MESKWNTEILGNKAEIKGRIGWKGYKKTDLRDSGPVVIGGMNIKNQLYLNFESVKHLSREKFDESPEIILKPGDILLVQRGNGIGDVGYFQGRFNEATINPTLIIISNFVGDSKFLFYYLSSPQGREAVLSLASGSSIPAIYQKPLSSLSFPSPPLPTQRAIAHILGSLDNKIALNRRMNETLEQMAQALFKSWFVDFDPVIDKALAAGHAIPEPLQARAARREALGEQRRALPGEVAGLFPDRFVWDEEMGWIPEGWEVVILNEIVSKANTGADAIKRAPIVDFDTGVKCARVGDFTRNRSIDEWGFCKTTEIDFEKFRLREGDILITRTSILGLSKIVSEDLSAVFNNGLIRIRTSINPLFIFQNFQSSHYKKYINRISGESSTRPNMKINYLLNYPLIIPEEKGLAAFSEILKTLFSRKDQLTKQLATLSQLRETLLPKLISGELSVSEATAWIDESL